jgi:hypothetical protein
MLLEVLLLLHSLRGRGAGLAAAAAAGEAAAAGGATAAAAGSVSGRRAMVAAAKRGRFLGVSSSSGRRSASAGRRSRYSSRALPAHQQQRGQREQLGTDAYSMACLMVLMPPQLQGQLQHWPKLLLADQQQAVRQQQAEQAAGAGAAAPAAWRV